MITMFKIEGSLSNKGAVMFPQDAIQTNDN